MPLTSKQKALLEMSKPLAGSPPYNPSKPTLILQKKATAEKMPSVKPQYKGEDGKYYLTPIARR